MASTTLIKVKDLLNIDKVVMEVTKMDANPKLAGWKSAHVYTYVGLVSGGCHAVSARFIAEQRGGGKNGA